MWGKEIFLALLGFLSVNSQQIVFAGEEQEKQGQEEQEKGRDECQETFPEQEKLEQKVDHLLAPKSTSRQKETSRKKISPVPEQRLPDILPEPRKMTFANFNPYALLNRFNFQQILPGVRPYLSSGFFPRQHLALGTIVEHPLGVSRLLLRSWTDYLHERNDAELQVEKHGESTFLFFSDTKKPLLRYYVQDAFTHSTFGKVNNLSKLYSALDGIVVRFRAEEKEYQGQLVAALPGNFFFGGRYAIQTPENFLSYSSVGILLGTEWVYGTVAVPLVSGPLQGNVQIYGMIGGFSYTMEGSSSPKETRIHVKISGSFLEMDL